jgi:hypothetical protein
VITSAAPVHTEPTSQPGGHTKATGTDSSARPTAKCSRNIEHSQTVYSEAIRATRGDLSLTSSDAKSFCSLQSVLRETRTIFYRKNAFFAIAKLAVPAKPCHPAKARPQANDHRVVRRNKILLELWFPLETISHDIQQRNCSGKTLVLARRLPLDYPDMLNSRAKMIRQIFQV